MSLTGTELGIKQEATAGVCSIDARSNEPTQINIADRDFEFIHVFKLLGSSWILAHAYFKNSGSCSELK